MDIVFQNQDWLVINKPTGISTYGAFPGDRGVVELLRAYYGIETHCFSRLDQGTSGILVLACNPASAARAQGWQRRGLIPKKYVFLSDRDSERVLKKKSWTQNSLVDGKSAQTEFCKIGRSGNYFLYEARLNTGRKHQVRRHARESRVPILGDATYGGSDFPRVCLHCESVTLPDCDSPFEAPRPPSFGYLGDFSSDPGFLVALDRRGHFWKNVTQAFRLLHRGEMSSWDGAIDCYGDQLCLWNYEDGQTPDDILGRLSPQIKKLLSWSGAKGGVVKCAVKDPHNRGLVPVQKTFGEQNPDLQSITELGLNYTIDVAGAQHVGLFLDQRDNRMRVRQSAKGRRVANLFAYTCSFSIAALAGECDEVVSVDIAAPALEKGRQNVVLNLLPEDRAKFVRSDVRNWLKNAVRHEAGTFGLIVCDPPTFAKSRAGGLFSLTKEWAALVENVYELLQSGGEALFCNNHREGERDLYRAELVKNFPSIIDLRPPLDFPQPHKQESVRMFWCRKD